MRKVCVFLSLTVLGIISISIPIVKFFDIDIEKALSIVFKNEGNSSQSIEVHNSENVLSQNVNGNNNITQNINGESYIIIEKKSQENFKIINFNYIRMFDIKQVPLFMRYIENTYTSCVDYHKSAQGTIEEITKENPKCFLTKNWRKFSASSNEYKEFIKKIGIPSNDVGFLFLVLENNTEQTFYDIEITFYNTKISSDKKITKELLKKIPCTKETKNIALLRPHKAFIWLLAVYKANNDGFPEYYLSDVTIPSTIEYLYNQKKQIQEIRKPYGENAITVPLPSHWISENGQCGWSGQ